jgi:hypothetical protein
MDTSSDPPERKLDSALLLLSREARVLADLLSFVLPEEQIAAWAKAAGRRKPGRPQPALQLAEALSLHHKVRGQVALALHDSLPDAPAESDFEEQGGPPADLEPTWPRLVGLLRSCELADWESALALMSHADWTWPESAPHRQKAAQASSASRSGKPQANDSKAAAAPRAIAFEIETKRVARIQEQLKAARQETAALQEEIGHERRRRLAEESERSQVLAEAEAERLRATELKQQLARSSSKSKRENQLDSELKELRHSAHVLGQKVAWLEEERDDLRGVLADHDRFDAIHEDDVPSFRDRPLTQPEQELTRRLEERRASGAPAFRVLVVGGGQPQHRHQGKLVEYAESLGFRAHWRMAEYQAWHRAMDGLRRDMQERYDALVILHWNRTTFTRKAREICDSGGAKPCLTCHYEGFTNLRESLQECLRELLSAAKRDQAK